MKLIRCIIPGNKKRFVAFFIFIFLFLLSTAKLFSQVSYYVVKGKVIDKNSKSPLQAASVFAQNTTLGVASDANGNFTIKLPDGGYSLVVTYTGYETEAIRITNASSQNDSLLFELSPKE